MKCFSITDAPSAIEAIATPTPLVWSLNPTSVLNKFGGAEILDTKPSGDDYWDYPVGRASLITNLTANDNVRVMVIVETDTSWGVNYTMSHFKGYLIG